MKKILMFVVLLSSLFLLAACSTDSIQEKYENLLGGLVAKDAEHNQWFEDLTRAQVYERFTTKTKAIDLSTMWLSKVPDLCSLVEEQDQLEVWHISLANNNIKVVDVDLGCFRFLQSLNLSYNNIASIENIGELPMLKSLSLKKNELHSTDGLPQLPSLEELNIGYNKLKKVANIDQYTNLKSLELQHNLIEQIVGVETLKKLEKIKLESNKLKDIKFLDGLDNLILVTAKGNEIAEDLLSKWNTLNELYLKNLTNAKSSTGSN